MKLNKPSNHHLTYCLNVHPGESWQENLQAIKSEALQVKSALAPQEPFALGLRLSALAASELRKDDNLVYFKKFLADNDCYIFTINGFPYGNFHKGVIKEQVYAPDWATTERLTYSLNLLEILSELLPSKMNGSISTIPISYKYWKWSEESVAANLATFIIKAAEKEKECGVRICLGLEPEPDCVLGSCNEVLDFFQIFCVEKIIPILKKISQTADYAEGLLHRHLGVCFDTAHFSVEFNNLCQSKEALQNAGINICKWQISAALQCHDSCEVRKRLKPFANTTYLHQVKSLKDDKIISYKDLDIVLRTPQNSITNIWRIHYHIPLFWAGDTKLQSTRSEIVKLLRELLKQEGSQLEIETYTFAVLPKEMQIACFTTGIIKEFQWLLEEIKNF